MLFDISVFNQKEIIKIDAYDCSINNGFFVFTKPKMLGVNSDKKKIDEFLINTQSVAMLTRYNEIKEESENANE